MIATGYCPAYWLVVNLEFPITQRPDRTFGAIYDQPKLKFMEPGDIAVIRNASPKIPTNSHLSSFILPHRPAKPDFGL